MKKISKNVADDLRESIAKADVKTILRKLKKAGGFSEERGVIKTEKNYQEFLVAHKMQYSNEDIAKRNNNLFGENGAYMSILNKLKGN